ncbi:PIG-L deacetylase family protein [Candidatus Margulisiibacteriota bacterium]
MNDVLVIAAHPDDEVLGCGGTIVNHIHNCDEVFLMILADGVTSRRYDPQIERSKEIVKAKKEIDVRKHELYAAAEILGIKKDNILHCGLPDQRLDVIPILDIIKKIEDLANKVSPDIVYTHHWGDLNKDHRVVHEATLTAFRPSKPANRDISIACFEIPGNMNILQPKRVNMFNPNHFVDISTSLPIKLKALKAYTSESREAPYPTSLQGVRELSIKRANDMEYALAEAFVRL